MVNDKLLNPPIPDPDPPIFDVNPPISDLNPVVRDPFSASGPEIISISVRFQFSFQLIRLSR